MRKPRNQTPKALASRRRNLAIARAARSMEPRPWRSGIESRVIEQLVWQWWLTTRGAALTLSPNAFETAIPSGARARITRPKAKPRLAPADRPWKKLRVARLLGVSHAWVGELVQRFEADPHRMRRRMAAFAPATYNTLLHAREETRRQRALGWLRPPIRSWRVKVLLHGRKRTVILPTQVEKRRRAGLPPNRWSAPIRLPYADLPAWAKGIFPPLPLAIAPSPRAVIMPPVHAGMAAAHPGIAPPARTTMIPPVSPPSATPRPVRFVFRHTRPRPR